MTAPARITVPRHGRATAPSRRETATLRGRSPAVARAYARRAQRTGPGHAGRGSADTGRTPFVVLVMALLGMALVATLWLSTAATADSYHLQSARKVVRNLTERSESLGRDVATLETAPELARRARELGMVPAGDPARLVVRPDGAVTLIGQPRRAVAPAPPAVVPAPPASAVAPLTSAPVPPAAAPGQSVPAPPVAAAASRAPAPPELPPPAPAGRT